MLTSNTIFIPPVATYPVCFLCLWVFLMCKQVHLCHILDSTYKWYHMLFVFLFLTYWTYDNLEVYPCYCKCQYFILFLRLNNILHLLNPFICQWTFRLLPCLLPLSHFSRGRLSATPQTAAHQPPPSLGFSKQEHWSGLPCPSPMHESEKWKWSRSVVSHSQRPHGLQPSRLLRPWDFPGKSTGVWCHCLLHVRLLLLWTTGAQISSHIRISVCFR